ncbi:MAG: tRNA (adenosine(37)-N6)-dimethylallyltransferase MiaA [Endomicrobium sp.]|jgi:tRNA dimethylallyltransferase|nr:tRNA (adenosine(37)-N6)-dimethylallyltransferase MiaA [Endomicrobium sp.]
MNIIVISGPTCSGKTNKAIQLCKKLNGEIVSCDSRQIYKYLNIGTNKKGVLVRNGLRTIEGIKQHLVDIIDPDQFYNVAQFVKDADKIIANIIHSKKVPIITGGCGLYIKALLYGIDKMPKSNVDLRNTLRLKSCNELYNQLKLLDPESAKKNQYNPQRLIRALEINIMTKKTMKELYSVKHRRYNFKHYNIMINKNILYNRINNRCQYMLNNGLINETHKIIKMGFNKNTIAMTSIGYRHIIKYLENIISKDELFLEFSKDTRNYAKRQITWFKHQPDIEFIL